MNYILKMIIAFVLSSLLFACSSEKHDTQIATEKTNKSAVKTAKDNEEVKRVSTQKPTKVRFPKLRMLPSNPNTTEYAIGTISGQRINKKTIQPIEVSGDKLVVTGWAIDKPSNKVPGDLFLDVDGQKHGVVKGKSPKYLKKMFDNPALHSAGFRANVPLSKLSKGKHVLSLYVIAADKKSFYTPKESYEIIIK